MTYARFWGAIVLSLMAAACGGEKQPTEPRKASVPAAPTTQVPVSQPTATAVPEPPPAAKQADPPAAPAAPAPPSAESLVKGYKDALYAVASCEKRPNSIQVKNTSECLKPLWDARKAIRQAPAEVAPEAAARQALRDKVRDVLLQALDQPDRTVMLYALMNNQAEFDREEPTLKKLESLMTHEDASIAEWAAIARFRQRRPDDAPSLTLAQATLKEHVHDRVRLAACQFLGDTAFKATREHYDLLLSYANNQEEKKLIRSCAVTRLGYVGEEKDIKAIAGFLADVKLQYSAVYALRHGINSKEAFAAYVDFYLKNAKSPDAIEWGSLSIFVPWQNQLDNFPTEKAVKAMSLILTNPAMNGWARKRAADNLGKLRAADELKKAAKVYEKPSPEDKQAADLASAIARALTEAERPPDATPPPPGGPDTPAPPPGGGPQQPPGHP
jgi:hypothetical protein